jgi:hypothetical protein
MEGVKYDQDKPRYELLPVGPIEETVKVLTCGAKKYDDFNWAKVKPFRPRYYAAAIRHIFAWWRGETNDPETGLHHLAHAMCCLIFLMEGPSDGP